MKKRLTLFILFICFVCMPLSYAQVDTQTAFEPQGRIILTGFFDYSTDFHKDTGFDIKRALVGYNYRFTRNLSAQVVLDGASGKKDNRLEVYLRNAFVTWQDGNLKVNAGVTGLYQFSLQENYWGHRYVAKTHQDLNNMGHSVDLGITGSYTFSKLVSIDGILTNGSGYKHIEKTGSQHYALGVNVQPIAHLVLRAYAGVYDKNTELRDALPQGITDANYKNQYNLSFFMGYRNNKTSTGAEFSKQYNKGFIEDKDVYGFSVFSTLKIRPKWAVYARYDYTDSKTPALFNTWWNNSDGQLLIAGVELSPCKQIKISPNFRNMNFSHRKSEQYLFVNLLFEL